MAPHPLRGAAAVVGVADAAAPSGMLDGSVPQLEARMIREALDDAGLTLADVDGVSVNNGLGWAPSLELAERLGITPRWTDSTQTGGSSFEIHVQHAAAAIALGLAEVVVVVYASTPRSDFKAGTGGWGSRQAVGQNPQAEWERPHGLRMPMGAYALAASAHMHAYGTTSEQLAAIAVQTREWAAMNPRARLQERITVEDVLASPVEASPLHKLDCCLVTDGAGALVLTSAERARSLAKPPAFVLGAGTAHTHAMISQMPDLTETGGVVSGREAFRTAGLAPSDVDVVELYDSFTITVLLALEDLGFCAKGEGGAFVAEGPLGPGGALPTNTNGGGLAYTHPGQYGMFLLVEAVRQLRGEGGDRQVPGAEVALAHGSGGVLSALSTVILGTEATL
ncbi:acetyl-CoA acetyltransferase [Iamia majanohamensis]|uniref:Acetyl-CoA acetyltransferase n=1 Tax=Iamia majanohamensis TaxID=467976 RepID=A0AAE9Y769_9ACTN|nr:acetyl-CoA acetyltransferase [Iamia majanohamensis]WCO65564.1 acetyl-CoA acetyltransferase [Iamia majanohamensis]